MSSPSEASDKIASATGSLPDPILQLANAPIVVRYVAALAMTALATAVAVAFDSTMAVPNLSLVFRDIPHRAEVVGADETVEDPWN